MPRQTLTIFLVQNDSIYLDVKLKVFKKDKKKEFRLVQNLTMGEADFDHFIRLRNHLIIAARNFASEEKLCPVLIPKLSKDMDEQLKLSHKVVDLMDRANRRICVTLLPWSVDKRENFYAQVRFFARKKEDEKFQQSLNVHYKLEEFIHLLDIISSVYDNVTTKQRICNVR